MFGNNDEITIRNKLLNNLLLTSRTNLPLLFISAFTNQAIINSDEFCYLPSSSRDVS